MSATTTGPTKNPAAPKTMMPPINAISSGTVCRWRYFPTTDRIKQVIGQPHDRSAPKPQDRGLAPLTIERQQPGRWSGTHTRGAPSSGMIERMPIMIAQNHAAGRSSHQNIKPPSSYESARDVARALTQTTAYQQSRHERKKVEMLFAHLKRILRFDRLRLRGLTGANDEFILAATAQNLRRLAKLCGQPPPEDRRVVPA